MLNFINGPRGLNQHFSSFNELSEWADKKVAHPDVNFKNMFTRFLSLFKDSIQSCTGNDSTISCDSADKQISLDLNLKASPIKFAAKATTPHGSLLFDCSEPVCTGVSDSGNGSNRYSISKFGEGYSELLNKKDVTEKTPTLFDTFLKQAKSVIEPTSNEPTTNYRAGFKMGLALTGFIYCNYKLAREFEKFLLSKEFGDKPSKIRALAYTIGGLACGALSIMTYKNDFS